MSHIDFEPGKMILDFSKGFSLVSLIEVTEQKRSGRKVIFEIGHMTSPFKLTLGLDDQDNLNLWLKDVKNKDYVMGSILKNDFFNKRVLVVTEIKKNIKTEFVEISLTLIVSKNKILKLEDKINADLGSKTPVNFVIGATLDHNENAAFIMGNLSIYNTIFSKEEKEKTLVNLLDAEDSQHE